MRHGATQVGRNPRHVYSTEGVCDCDSTCNEGRTRKSPHSQPQNLHSSSSRGLALCPLCHPAWAQEGTLVGPSKDTRYTSAHTGGEAVGGPNSQTNPVTHRVRDEHTEQIHGEHNSNADISKKAADHELLYSCGYSTEFYGWTAKTADIGTSI